MSCSRHFHHSLEDALRQPPLERAIAKGRGAVLDPGDPAVLALVKAGKLALVPDYRPERIELPWSGCRPWRG